MKALLAAVGVLGLAVCFGVSRPAPASTRPVTSDDVRVVSEQIESGPLGGRNRFSMGANARKLTTRSFHVAVQR